MKVGPRIIIASESLYPCGVKTVIEGCARAIQSAGWPEPILIGPEPSDKMHFNGVWLPYRTVSKKRNYRCTLLISPSTNRILIESLKDADIIHIHSVSLLSIRIINLVKKLNECRARKIKVILHIHTQFDEYLKTWFPAFSSPLVSIASRLTEYCCNNVDLVIFPTDFYKRIFEKKISFNTSAIVWNAPITIKESFEGNCLSDLVKREIPNNTCVFTFIGRICGEKDIKGLLDFFTKIKSCVPSAVLILIGPGDISLYECYAVSLGVGDSVYFLGQRSHSDTLKISSLSTFGISLSITEVQGLGILELMALGIPVITKGNTCWEDFINESGGGIIINSEDTAICQIASMADNHHLLSCIGERGKNIIQSTMSPERQYKALNDIYNSLLQ